MQAQAPSGVVFSDVFLLLSRELLRMPLQPLSSGGAVPCSVHTMSHSVRRDTVCLRAYPDLVKADAEVGLEDNTH